MLLLWISFSSSLRNIPLSLQTQADLPTDAEYPCPASDKRGLEKLLDM